MGVFGRRNGGNANQSNHESILRKIEENETQEFDLNIEKILENWEVHHAIREIISNAIDEQVLTNTEDIKIFKENDIWHIIDYGRGLNYHHLTQNESEEKLANDNLIGRFGVGLKDALATLHRHNIEVTITSKYGFITLIETSKTGFNDIVTLHAKIEKSSDENMIGTDFALKGCEDCDIERAKHLFLKFAKGDVLQETNYGQIISNNLGISSIYINGVKVAEEGNFLFSYNITSLTKQLKKALNRERTNVGRTAYSDRIKSILLAATDERVITELINDLQQYNSGLRHDELAWNDVAMYASKKIGEFKKNVVFITSDTAVTTPSIIDEMIERGLDPVVVPEVLINKIDEYNQEVNDNDFHIMTTNQYINDMEERRNYTFVDESQLNELEKTIFSKTERIIELIGGKPYRVKDIKISETIYESEIFSETVGIWDPMESLIVIKRNQLKSLKAYTGTLIHECMHAKSGADDVSREFERALTDVIGVVVSNIIRNS